MTEGYTSGKNNKNKRIPLQYFPLQTGTKIQLRMGYTNNPDALFPVFAGIVTEIEPGDETITITAQSFLMGTPLPGLRRCRHQVHRHGREHDHHFEDAEVVQCPALRTLADQVSPSCLNQKTSRAGA